MLGFGNCAGVIAITLLFLHVIAIHRNATGALVRAGAQDENSIAGQELYNSSDSVVILNVTNFKQTVHGSSSGWLVEFYNSWCGFCYRFAPTWKALARDVHPWWDIVKVAAIDCANDDNNPVCREYEIMYYPTLKFFPVNAHPSFLGVAVEKGEDMDAVRRNLIDRLEKEQQEGRGSTWPNITPYRNAEAKDLWKAASDTVKYIFLIFENTESHIGAEVILDMHNINSLRIRRVTSDNESLRIMYNIAKFPSVIVFSRDEAHRLLHVRVPSRKGIRRIILDYVHSKGVIADDPITMIDRRRHEDQPHRQTETVNRHAKAINENANANATATATATATPTATPTPTATDDLLYRVDLDSALGYAIYHEIPLRKSIEGEKMVALKRFLDVLIDYYPRGRTHELINSIRGAITRETSITGKNFKEIARSAKENASLVHLGSPRWIGCQGSTPTFRGYPCGLWTIFHMLTVNFALRNESETHENPTKVLRAMHDYIHHFFGCGDCAQHFVHLARNNNIYEIRNGDENILWLWRAHNQVNARLAGDETEDPRHKKLQYPAQEYCPTCRYDNGSWRMEQVLDYLKHKYSYASISYYGSNIDTWQVSNDMLQRSRNMAFKYRWDFTVFDISICVVLYVACATILIAVCIKFAVKRTYRKRSYVSLIGRV